MQGKIAPMSAVEATLTPHVESILERHAGLVIVAIIIGLAITLTGFVPRREWKAVNPDGTAIIEYDRWTGRFQRVTFTDKGNLLSDVYTAP
jgi:hypothetical protein